MTLGNISIGRKLILAFAAVIVACAGASAGVLLSLAALQRISSEGALTDDRVSAIRALETAAVESQNSMRGFAATADPDFQTRYASHVAEFNAAVEAMTKADPQGRYAADLAGIQQIFAKFDTEAKTLMTLARDPATRGQAQSEVSTVRLTDFRAATGKVLDAEDKHSATLDKEQESAFTNAYIAFFAGSAVALAITGAMIWLLTRTLAAPVVALTRTMGRLAEGDNTVEVPALERGDEIGRMGQAVLAFRQAAIEKQRLEQQAETLSEAGAAERRRNEEERAIVAREQAAVVADLGAGLERLAQGDLTFRLTTEFPADYRKVQDDFNAAMAQIEEAMRTIAANTDGIRSGSTEISQAADDLSRRTEQQAAALEETAAALDQITATVKRSADGAKKANALVGSTRADAETGGEVVRNAVAAMGEIENSARQISQIIGVIDEIAFQTNLLALNAGVEAARAGDAGRGFAVVAQEVRALAGRSADAAKEIKGLISASSQQVGTGVQLVGQSGEVLTRIVGQVGQVAELVGEIAASAQEQAVGLNQVNSAVNQMDQTTQQNAAMVEQSTAASHALAREAQELSVLMSRFHVSAAGRPASARPAPPRSEAHAPARAPGLRPAPATATARPGAAPVQAMRQRLLKTFGGAPAEAQDGWEEF